MNGSQNNMVTISIETLIIGAGPAGMAAAMELSKKGKKFIVLEKEVEVGGLSKTYKFEEDDGVFLTDNGPHRFFSKNPYLYDFIGELIGKDWIEVKRQTRQYIDGKFYDYPINAFQALSNIGFRRSFKMLFDYVFGKIIFSIFRKKINNFEDYVVANFGKSLGDFCMINYTEKIWGISAKKIHPDWAGQRITGLNLRSVIMNSIKKVLGIKDRNSAKSLVNSFYYPKFGTGEIYETIREKLQSLNYQFYFNIEVVEVFFDTKRREWNTFVNTPSGKIHFTSKYLVESVPLVQFLSILRNVPKPIIALSKKLKYRHQRYAFLTLNKETVTSDQWIYFPEKNISIGRMSEMKNFSKEMCPTGTTSLFVEFFCFEEDEIWKKSKEDFIDFTIGILANLGFLKKEEIRKGYDIKMMNVYPVYDLDYKKNLLEIKTFLDGLSNLIYIGRPGRFRYNNQDHSLEMGILAAKMIIENKKYDIESIGEEKEYFEAGKRK